MTLLNIITMNIDILELVASREYVKIDDVVKHTKKSKKNVQKRLKDMVENNVISKDTRGYKISVMGSRALHDIKKFEGEINF